MRTSTQLGQVTVIRLVRDEDATTAPALDIALRSACRSGSVVVDLCDSVFIDGAVAGVIVSVAADFPRSIAVVLPDAHHHPARRLLVDLFVESSLAAVFATTVQQAERLLQARQIADADLTHSRVAAAIRSSWAMRAQLNDTLEAQRQLLLENRSLREARRRSS